VPEWDDVVEEMPFFALMWSGTEYRYSTFPIEHWWRYAICVDFSFNWPPFMELLQVATNVNFWELLAQELPQSGCPSYHQTVGIKLLKGVLMRWRFEYIGHMWLFM